MSFPNCDRNPVDVNDLNILADLGGLYVYAHPDYGTWIVRYTQLKDAVTYVAGHVLTLAVKTRRSMTNDISGGSSIGSIVGGVGLRVYTQNYYGYVLVDGYYPTVVTSGADDIAVGEAVFVHGSTDGACDGASASTFATGNFGVAVEADVNADNTCAIDVRGLI